VGGSEALHPLRAFGGEVEPGDPLVGGVGGPLDEAGLRRSIDELHDAVVAKEQVVGDVSDRRRAVVAPNGEEQLVLCRGETDRLRLLLAPPLEASEAVAEVQEAAVVVIGQREGDSHIVTRYNTGEVIAMTDLQSNPAHLTAPAPAPAAMARPSRRILVGSDGSPGSMRAIGWAAQMAGATDAVVTVVHVLTPNQELMRDFSFETMHLWRRDLERELRGPWVEPLRRLGVTHRCRLLEADTVTAGLVRTARDIDADLLVVSTRGRGRSSASNLLAQRSGRPVVVVPSNWEPPYA
jgi:nucleotide-binding universal stress UspA family protein